MRRQVGRIPLWIKIVYTAFVVVLVPVYAAHHGVGNFLWFSNVALLTTAVAIWLEHRLLFSMMALATLLPETGWLVDFLARLVTGYHLFGLTAYMWDPLHPALVRGLSLYHIPLPLLLLWLVYRFGYDKRALVRQTALAWVVLVATYVLTEPARNINYAFGWFEAGDGLPQPWHLLSVMVVLPVLVYAPTHLVLRYLFPRPMGR
jgi:hypothetical protein